MSHWKAYARVREVPETELRGALVSALETLHYVANALEVSGMGEESLLDAIQELKDAKDCAEQEAVDAQAAAVAAEEKLEEKLQEEHASELEKMRERAEKAEDELEALRGRLAKVEPLLDAYSDTLAFARKFVTLAEGAGVKPRHVRVMPKQARVRGQVKT